MLNDSGQTLKSKLPIQILWNGKRIEELDRKELLEAFRFLFQQKQSLSHEMNRMRPHMNWVSYLKRDEKN